MRTKAALLALVFCGCMDVQAPEESTEEANEESLLIGPGISPPMREAYEEYLRQGGGFKPETQGIPITAKCANEDFQKAAPGMLSKRAAYGNVVGIHNGGLSKRHYTWSIVRPALFGGNYTPDPISDANVEMALQKALSAWASVSNVSFERVSSGGEITFEWLPNTMYYPDPKPDNPGWVTTAPVAIGVALPKDATGQTHAAILPEAYGARILFANIVRDGGPEIHLDWSKSSLIFTTALHEIGHFLGLKHSVFDNGNYGCVGCYHPQPNDPSIMGNVDLNKCNTGPVCGRYLSAYDVSVIEQKYGTNPVGRPFLELWIPGWSKHFYTTSWHEANVLVNSGFAYDITWFHGMIYKNQHSGTTSLHRHYTPHPHGGKHYYSTGSRLYSPTPISHEGVMGYINAPDEGGSHLQSLRKVYASSIDNHLFVRGAVPGGYVDQGIIGHIVPYDKMPTAWYYGY